MKRERAARSPPPPVALAIAGSDSCGGAGIQADLKTFHRFGVFGTSVVTAVTAQNTQGVRRVHVVPPDIVRDQVRAVVSDLRPQAVKTGMLANAANVSAVCESLRALRGNGQPAVRAFVLDPVMVATSGDRLLRRDAEAALAAELLPLATVITPNLAEAGLLLGSRIGTFEQMREAAHALVGKGARAVLVKGGHLTHPGGLVLDLLVEGSAEHVWRRRRLGGGPYHGTGCTLAAAVAAGLAKGEPLVRAVGDAIGYVAGAIASSPSLGAGSGLLNHSAPVVRHRPAS